MKTQLIKLINKYREIIAYGFFGVMTVIVNTAIFLGLSIVGVGSLTANTIAFFIAVAFAYYTNTRYVFRDNFTIHNFLQFLMMRLGTLFIDNGGLVLLINMGCNKLIAPLGVNILVIIFNYIFSKFFIYKKGREEE